MTESLFAAQQLQTHNMWSSALLKVYHLMNSFAIEGAPVASNSCIVHLLPRELESAAHDPLAVQVYALLYRVPGVGIAKEDNKYAYLVANMAFLVGTFTFAAIVGELHTHSGRLVHCSECPAQWHVEQRSDNSSLHCDGCSSLRDL